MWPLMVCSKSIRQTCEVAIPESSRFESKAIRAFGRNRAQAKPRIRRMTRIDDGQWTGDEFMSPHPDDARPAWCQRLARPGIKEKKRPPEHIPGVACHRTIEFLR